MELQNYRCFARLVCPTRYPTLPGQALKVSRQQYLHQIWRKKNLEDTKRLKLVLFKLRQNKSCSSKSGLASYYSRLSLSRIPRDSLKYYEISVSRHITFAELRKNNSNNHI